MKQCNRCRLKKPLDQFFSNSKSEDRHQRTCKECQLTWQREKRRRVQAGEWRPQRKLKHPAEKKICTSCLKALLPTVEFFTPMRMGHLGLSPACRSCRNRDRQKRRQRIPWGVRLIEYVNGPRHTSKTTEPFDLTPEFLEEMFNKQGGQCAWTGVTMVTEVNGDRLRLLTLDRLDNSRGYTKDNVVLVCKAANQARGNASPEEFVRFIDDVRG